MRAIKTAVLTIVATSLLVGGTMAAAANGDEAVFKWGMIPNDDGWGATSEAGDSRASGVLSPGVGEALVTDALTLASISLRLPNDEGTWTGTGRSISGDREQGQGWELTGDGAYSGLSLFLISSPAGDASWGVILPTDAIPPYPEAPTE